MDSKRAEELYEKALKDIAHRSLSPAITSIYKLINSTSNFDTKESLSEAETTYRFLLKYLLEGKEDAEREKQFSKLQIKLTQIATEAYEQAIQNYSYQLYFEKRRSKSSLKYESIQSLQEHYRSCKNKLELLKPDSPAETLHEVKLEMEEAVNKLFYRIWLFGTNKEQVDFEISGCLISALTLRLLQHFGEDEMLTLIDAYEHGGPEVHWRALCGIIILIQQQELLISLTPALISRISLLKDIPGFQQELFTVLIMLIRSFESESISKKLEEDIMGNLSNLQKKMDTKISLKDIIGDPNFLDKNPEWKENIDLSKIEKKINEINDLQQEGADMMLSAFSTLKSFPFFHETANWFLPFDTEHSVLSSIIKNNQEGKINFLKTLHQSVFICNSDKYSFCLNLNTLPKDAVSRIITNYRSDMDEMNKIEEEDRKSNRNGTDNYLAKEYIQDLYRFFKFHPRKDDFNNFFNHVLELHRSPLILDLISGTDSLNKIGAFYFNKNLFKEALEVFNLEINNGHDDPQLYQQKGFCLQELGDKEKALSAYLHAELLDGKNFWTLRKIAGCYRQLKMNDKAIEYAEKAGALKPDNLSIESLKAYCYLELKDYEEALRSFHKIDYLDNTSHKAWRPIAWCYFLIGKQSESLKYHEKILSNKPEVTDYLNAGHAYWIAGNVEKAVSYYVLGATLLTDIEEFLRLFDQDVPILREKGIPAEMTTYMPDIIYFEYRSKKL
ncbi:MAG: hypothetical protein PHI48_00270 [Bacteroidales bacterium]|nr:hypothetical protein [Bacteroidales bacterium]